MEPHSGRRVWNSAAVVGIVGIVGIVVVVVVVVVCGGWEEDDLLLLP